MSSSSAGPSLPPAIVIFSPASIPFWTASTMAVPHSKTVYPIEELREAVEQPPPSRDWHKFTSSSIILDNGASTLRAGWSAEDAPRIVTENLGAKYRDRKTNRNILLTGSEAYVDATSRGNIKSPFEGDIVANFDQMVRVCVWDRQAS
jgi:hypothetical protein